MIKISTSLLLFLCLFCNAAFAQNAFYDAQSIASLTVNEKARLTGVIDDIDLKKNFSDEEITALQQLKGFLQNPFADTLRTLELNPQMFKKILKKLDLIAERKVQSAVEGNGLKSLGKALSVLSVPSVGNDISRMKSADFQTMLIDAAATYIAESFKEDMTYMYFSKFRARLDSNAICKDLLPQTAEAIKKVDPFNFRNLGDSWKSAFEADIQNLPVGFSAFVRNNANKNEWCKKVNESRYFEYYNFATDVYQPLIKGMHPVEIIQTLDQKYYSTPLSETNGGTSYKSMIHFLNILQFNLQDSTKKETDNQYENLWISFSQLNELNTENKRKYFFALMYQQDRDFFTNDHLGKEIGKFLLTPGTEGYQKVLKSFRSFLILLNQIEGSMKEITKIKANGGDFASVIPAYLKNVRNVADSTNSILKQIPLANGGLTAITTNITTSLNYCNDAYAMYTDVTTGNYSGAMNRLISLMENIDARENISLGITKLQLIAGFSKDVKAIYDLWQTNNGQTAISEKEFTDNLLSCINYGAIDLSKFSEIVRLRLQYNTLPKDEQHKIDGFLKKLDKPVISLNETFAKAMQKSSLSGYFKTITLLNKYSNVIAGVANAETSADLQVIIKKYIAPSSSFAVQRNSLHTIALTTKVGARLGGEGNARFKEFRPNLGLTVPIGIEFSWANKGDKKTATTILDSDYKVKYLKGSTSGFYLQLFDIGAVVNYRLFDNDSTSLPDKILLKQVFSPGLSFNHGFKNSPFDMSIGIQYTPQLRKIGADLQANSVNIFFRIAWSKPLIFLYNRRETKKENGI